MDVADDPGVTVIEESSIEFEHEVEDTEEVVEKFKDFLDEVTPEDFAAVKSIAETIGQAVSSGCIRMTNEDVVDLYNRVSVGTTGVVKH